MKKINFVFICFFITTAFAFGQGLITDFTGGNETPLVTRGDFVLRGTVLVKYLGTAADIVIPSNLGITEIGDDVFNMATITSVVIPEGVQRIGARAFNDCYALTSVTIPGSIKVLDTRAFNQCYELAGITLPNGLSIIGSYAFSSCPLNSITVPSSVTAISSNAFGTSYYSSNNFPSSITMPANIAYIDTDAAPNRFGAAYNANGRKAGNYISGFGGWRTGTDAAPPSTSITPGTARNAALQTDRMHMYRVTVPAGHALTTSLKDVQFYSKLMIYNSAGEQILTKTTGWGTSSTVTEPLNGTYYIGITGNSAPDQGAYSLNVSTEQVQFSDIASGTAHNATLPAGGSQFYRVTIPTGHAFTVSLQNPKFSSVLTIYNAAWKQVFTRSGSSNTNLISNAIPLNGTFYIGVRGNSNTAQGAYSLQISTEAVHVLDISPGTVYVATLPIGGSQFYRFTVPSGAVLRLTVYTESNYDTVMWLHDADWKQIYYDDDSGSDSNASISHNVSAGTYYIRVSGYGSGAAGPYSLHVSAETAQ